MKSIKVRTGYNERKNTYLYETFDIVDSMPVIGDEFHNEEVIGIQSVNLDCEERNEEAFEYNYFYIDTKDDDGEEDYYKIAVPVSVLYPPKKFQIEVADAEGNYDNWYCDYTIASTEEEAIELYKQWIIENTDWSQVAEDVVPEEYVEALNYRILEK